VAIPGPSDLKVRTCAKCQNAIKTRVRRHPSRSSFLAVMIRAVIRVGNGGLRIRADAGPGGFRWHADSNNACRLNPRHAVMDERGVLAAAPLRHRLRSNSAQAPLLSLRSGWGDGDSLCV
jgi:hypothetical protein